MVNIGLGLSHFVIFVKAVTVSCYKNVCNLQIFVIKCLSLASLSDLRPLKVKPEPTRVKDLSGAPL